MGFMRVVEVFPPLFRGRGRLDVALAMDGFLSAARRVSKYADLVMVADVKDTDALKVSPLSAASLILSELSVEAFPVVVARDSNRPLFASLVLTAVAQGLGALMLSWGDRYRGADRAKNVYDFRSLSEAVRLARDVAERTGAGLRIFAPVDLSSRRGMELGADRLRAGADYLLAQPPTTDDAVTFDAHLDGLRRSGLAGRTLLGVFPFRSREDAAASARKFGWHLPAGLAMGDEGREALLSRARSVALRASGEGLAGVYLSTRGEPEVAERVLGSMPRGA